jgi:hypothetical protein
MSATQNFFFNNAWAIAEFEKLPLDSISDILNLVMSYKIDKLRREFTFAQNMLFCTLIIVVLRA